MRITSCTGLLTNLIKQELGIETENLRQTMLLQEYDSLLDSDANPMSNRESNKGTFIR